MMPNQMMGNPMNAMLNNPLQMLSELKSNPIEFLMRRRLKVPQNINVSDPQAILNHLVGSGQISQDQINQAYQMMQRMGR